MGSTEKKLDYEICRNYVVSLANQRISARMPRPADIGGVDQEEVDTGNNSQDQSGQEEYYGWDVGAITNPNNPNIVCHGCGGKSHIIANCPNQGKGKGKDGSKGSPPGKGKAGFQNNFGGK
eukprot:7109032-Karenia_brevis.AAC.1